MKYAKWRQRLRGITKWGGVTLCVLLFALWLASGWWWVMLNRYDSSRGTALKHAGWICRGQACLSIVRSSRDGPQLRIEWQLQGGRLRDGSLYGPPAPATWSGQIRRVVSPDKTQRFYWIPLWLPFLFIALPTGYLLWSDHRRRMRAGCCEKCGYDLTGNTTGRCSECGEDSVVVKKS